MMTFDEHMIYTARETKYSRRRWGGRGAREEEEEQLAEGPNRSLPLAARVGGAPPSASGASPPRCAPPTARTRDNGEGPPLLARLTFGERGRGGVVVDEPLAVVADRVESRAGEQARLWRGAASRRHDEPLAAPRGIDCWHMPAPAARWWNG